jgi:hypothetical protein
MTSSARFLQVLFLAAILLFREGFCLSSNVGTRFSPSQQARFGCYDNGEASLFGAGSVLYGAQSQPLWTGNKTSNNNNNNNDKPSVPFPGDRVESMTFIPSMKSSSQSSFVRGP